jgi:hypothetical protein
MSTTKGSPIPRGRRGRRYLRDFLPSAAADAELTWFFNEAEIAIDQPSNFHALVAGASRTSLEQLERRAEAMHAARKIHDRLRRLRSADVLLLSGLYTDRPWSSGVTRALPGGLAGAAQASLGVRVAYIRARARAETRAENLAGFIEEVVRSGRTELVTAWREELELACAVALRAYARVRRDGPSVVVPKEDP